MSRRRTVAMVFNENAGHLTPSGVSEFFASMLAPSGVRGVFITIKLTFGEDLATSAPPYSAPTTNHHWSRTCRSQLLHPGPATLAGCG